MNERMIIKISHILNISNLLHKWRERKLPIKKKKKRKENNFPSVINCAPAPCTSISTCSANNRENTTLLKKIKTSKQKPVKKGERKRKKR